MANLQAGSVGIDIFSGFSGLITIARSDLIQVSYGGTWIGNYWGTFQYSGTSLIGGTVGVYEELIDGQSILSITGLTVSATAAFARILADDTLGVLNLAFGGNDSMIGSTGGDTLVGLGGNDLIDGNAGDDDVNGNLGNDAVAGGAGADWVRGGQGNDTITGGIGDDPHVNGNIGNDLVSGGEGDDTVYGGQGFDTAMGDEGDDLLTGDRGLDVLVGGPGADRFYLQANSESDRILDFNPTEGDRIALPAGQAYTLRVAAGDELSIVIPGLFGNSSMTLARFTLDQFQASWIVYI